MKISVVSDDAWVDTVTFYKCTRFDVNKRLRVKLNGQPALDTGGVRTQLYFAVFEQFAQNRHVKLFDGPECHLRPLCTSEARSSGLFKVLGCMVAHSIAQAGVGFPYLSPACLLLVHSRWRTKKPTVSVNSRCLLPGSSCCVYSKYTDNNIKNNYNALISQLKDAQTNAEVMRFWLIHALDVLDKCGISTVVNVSNQNIISYSCHAVCIIVSFISLGVDDYQGSSGSGYHDI